MNFNDSGGVERIGNFRSRRHAQINMLHQAGLASGPLSPFSRNLE